jgi:hypothetical protein
MVEMEVRVAWHRQAAGELPQGLTHLAHIDASVALTEAERGV